MNSNTIDTQLENNNACFKNKKNMIEKLSNSQFMEENCDTPHTMKFNNKIKYIITGVLFYSWICLGLYNETLGPSLLTLIHITKSDFEKIGRVLFVREIGMFIGSLFGGWMADRWIKQRTRVLSFSLLLSSITIFCIPYCSTLLILSICLFFSGFSHGAQTANGNPLLSEFWRECSFGPFNFIHSGYGIGGAIAPELLKPFKYTLTHQNSTSTLISLKVPFAIIAVLCLICSLIFFLIGTRNCCCVKEKNSMKTDSMSSSPKSPESDEECEQTTSYIQLISTKLSWITSQTLALKLSPFVFLLYFILVGNERVFAKYLHAYIDATHKNFSADLNLSLNTSYWVAFSLARMLTVFIGLRVSEFNMFIVQLAGTCIVSFGLILFNSTISLFIVVILFGLFKSPLFPTGLGVINQIVQLSGLLVFIVNLGSSLGASALQYLAGFLINKINESVFPKLVSVTATVLALVGGVLICVAKHLKKKQITI